MWDNRPAVSNSISAPCKNCKDRKNPKTCEKYCVLWNDYKEKKAVLDKQIKDKKELDNMFINMYKNIKNKKREQK